MYQDPAGELTNEDAFNYNASTNTLAVENITSTTVTGSGVVKGSNTFGQRYATQAATNRAAANTASLTVERYFTVTAEGNGESFNIQSNTPSAGNKIVRKIWYKDEAFEATDVDTWTLLHTFADDTAYASTATKWQEYLDGQTYGTPPFTLAISWEEATLFTGLLNTYSGAAAAYSLRLLDSTYTGDAIRVRRASDNTEQDIGFDGNGDLDTSALTTFCTGTNGFVKTWYDQSGNAKDATQSTTANQPKIYDSSTGVILDNSMPALSFSGTNQLNCSANIGFSGANARSIFQVLQKNFSGNAYRSFQISPAGASGRRYRHTSDWGIEINGSFRTWLNADLTQLLTSLHFPTGSSAPGDHAFYKDGSLLSPSVTIAGTVDTLDNPLIIGEGFNGKIQEQVFYASDQTANRTGIETNINDYYSIY
jgi:hypothetical protein